MNHAHIPGFPNCLPHIYWKTYLPKFRDEEGDDDALHLLKFHGNIYRLRIEFPKDCLMNIFMASLEGKARSWYENCHLVACIPLKIFIWYFLRDIKFHIIIIIG